MIVETGGWRFSVDIPATMDYSSKEAAAHCDCGYCRNFYAAVDAAYPNLRPFLAQFGIDIEAPDELMPYDMDEEMWYAGVYAVSGKILDAGEKAIAVDGVEVYPEAGNGWHIHHECPEPCFFLEVEMLRLPWVLEEPMKEVVSTANTPSFLRRMWDRLLKMFRDDSLQS